MSCMTDLMRFRSWATDNGIQSRLLIKNSPGKGTGLFYSAFVDPFHNKPKTQKQEPLLLVPNHLLLCKSRVLKSRTPLVQETIHRIHTSKLSERLTVVLYLMHERVFGKADHLDIDITTPRNQPSTTETTSSQFRAYVRVLPEVATPVTIDPEIPQGYLAGTLLLDSVQAKRCKLEEEYEALSGLGGVFEHWTIKPTLEDFMWADATFWSRVLSFKSQSETGTSIMTDQRIKEEEERNIGSHDGYYHVDDLHMVPYLDFANHAKKANVRWQVTKNGVQVLEKEKGSVIKDWDENQDGEPPQPEELFLSYGEKPNMELLFLHGFILPDNPLKTLTIAMPMDEEDPYYLPKAHALVRIGIPPRITLYLSKPTQDDEIKDQLIELWQGLWITRESRNLLWIYSLNEEDGLSARVEPPTIGICLPEPEPGTEQEQTIDLEEEDEIGKLIMTINDHDVVTQQGLEKLVPELKIYPVILLRMMVKIAERVEHYIARITETGDRVQTADDVCIVQSELIGLENLNLNSFTPEHEKGQGEVGLGGGGQEDGGEIEMTPCQEELELQHQAEVEASTSNLILSMRQYRQEELMSLIAVNDILGQAQVEYLQDNSAVQEFLKQAQEQMNVGRDEEEEEELHQIQVQEQGRGFGDGLTIVPDQESSPSVE